MPMSEEYRSYESQQKKALPEICLPTSDKEPTGSKLIYISDIVKCKLFVAFYMPPIEKRDSIIFYVLRSF